MAVVINGDSNSSRHIVIKLYNRMKCYWIIKDPVYDRIRFFTRRPFEKAMVKDNGERIVTLKYQKRYSFTMKMEMYKRFFNYVPNKDELIYLKIDPTTILFYKMENKK